MLNQGLELAFILTFLIGVIESIAFMNLFMKPESAEFIYTGIYQVVWEKDFLNFSLKVSIVLCFIGRTSISVSWS